MEYNKLISITGLTGLYELLSSKGDGGIVRSLEDMTTKFVSNRLHTFSHLETIEVYTNKENANLIDVFMAMKNSSEQLPSDKDNNTIKKYFQKIFPDMDFERVYSSDMKKMVKWYDTLVKNDVELKLSEAPEQNTSTISENQANKTKSSTPTKTATGKSAPVKKINTPRKMA